MVIYDNEFETKENKILTKDKIEPQQLYTTKLKVMSMEITVVRHQPNGTF